MSTHLVSTLTADLAPLLDAAGHEPAIRRWAGSARHAHLDLTAPAGLRPLAVAELARERFVLAVTATGREAEDLTEALASLLGPQAVAYFPSWETLPHERLSPRADTVGRRLGTLRRLPHPDEFAQRPLRGVLPPARRLT